MGDVVPAAARMAACTAMLGETPFGADGDDDAGGGGGGGGR